MPKRVFLIKILLIFALGAAAPAGADVAADNKAEAFIGFGVKFYEKMHYGEAKKYFLEAKRLRLKTKYKKFASYALKTLDDYSGQFGEIERLNSALRTAEGPDRAGLIEKLNAAHLRLGKQLLLKNGYVSIVRPHFDYIISHDPLNLEAMLYLGNINYSGMLYEEAVNTYKKIIEAEPDNPFFRQRLGDIYAGLGIYDEARKCYAEAAGLFKKTRLLDKKDRIEYLKRLMRKMPMPFEDIKRLTDEGQYSEVVSTCKRRAMMNPADVTAITYMGAALEELGNWKQAEGLYRTAIKRNPDYPTPYYYLGRIYLLKRKNAQQAVAQIETFRKKAKELLEIDKSAQDVLIAALRTLVYIYHEILRDYKAAVMESKALVALVPNDQAAHYNLALSYAYLDKKAMAYEEFKKVIAINPDSKIAWSAKSAIEQLQKYPTVHGLPYSSEN